jgi:hypothetical protein
MAPFACWFDAFELLACWFSAFAVHGMLKGGKEGKVHGVVTAVHIYQVILLHGCIVTGPGIVMNN